MHLAGSWSLTGTLVNDGKSQGLLAMLPTVNGSDLVLRMARGYWQAFFQLGLFKCPTQDLGQAVR